VGWHACKAKFILRLTNGVGRETGREKGSGNVPLNCMLMFAGFDKLEDNSTKRKKRKRRQESIEERVVSALETTARNLQAQLRLDREHRIEEGKGLMNVLDKLVVAVTRMAEALEVRKA
jgi:hypothetical protein